MAVVEESVTIAQPPDVVFDFCSKAENLPVWDSSVLEAEQVGTGPVGVGTRARGISKVLGHRFEWTTEVVEFDAPRRATFRAVEGKLHFTVTNVMEPVDGGTRYTYRVEADSGLGGIFGKLADPVVQRAQARTVRANLETLADMLQEQSQR
ncbi:MAG: SRPBCC family protein [Pseudonocardiales bacterium]